LNVSDTIESELIPVLDGTNTDLVIVGLLYDFEPFLALEFKVFLHFAAVDHSVRSRSNLILNNIIPLITFISQHSTHLLHQILVLLSDLLQILIIFKSFDLLPEVQIRLILKIGEFVCIDEVPVLLQEQSQVRIVDIQIE